MLTTLMLLALTAPKLEPPEWPRVTPRLFRNEGRPSRNSLPYTYADYELAPLDGRGLGATCDCAPVTWHQGGTFSWLRASTAMCVKGVGPKRTTGINNGDMVECAVDRPRVVQALTGKPGLWLEEGRTNVAQRSEEHDNAYWIASGVGGGAVPTVTANQAVGPRNTTVAERIQFGATTGAQSSIIGALNSCPAAGVTAVASAYIKGNGTSGTIDVCRSDLGPCVSCAYVSDSWTRCVSPAGVGTTAHMYVGNAGTLNGGIARSANDVFVTGTQCEAGAFATSYIPTTNAAVARSADGNNTTFALPSIPSCWAMSVEGIEGTLERQLWVATGDAFATFFYTTRNAAGDTITQRQSPTITSTLGGFNTTGRYVGIYTLQGASATAQVCSNGVCASQAVGSSTMTVPISETRLGYNTALGYHINGIMSNIMMDDDTARCSQ